MAGKLLVYYLGDDEAYFRTLQGDFKKFTRLDLDFKKIYQKDEAKIQALFNQINKLQPAAVFIDFSKETQDYLHLARLLTRTPMEHKLLTVGLVDLLSPPEVMIESISAGVNITHIKGAESFDVVFDVAKLLTPTEAGEHGFATAPMKEDLEVGVPCKVGYIDEQTIHFETDFKVSVGDRLKLKHHWSLKNIYPSQSVFVKNVGSSNLFYQFKQNVDADFLIVDEFLPPEGMVEVDIKERKQNRLEKIDHHKQMMDKWISDNLSKSQEKKAKVLVVDREYIFYQDQKRTDKHPYTIRCVAYLKEMKEELDKLHPQVIAISLEKDGTGTKNNFQMLQTLVATIKGHFNELNPFLVVFNTKTNSKELQTSLDYEHVMATENELSVEVLVKMAEIFEKKMKSIKKTGKNPNAGKVFIKKNNVASIAEIMIPIKVMKLSETDMLFQCEAPIAVGMNLHMTSPVDMHIQVQPAKTQGKVPEYYGLIHCLGESEKKELRRYINLVFFREHDAQLSAQSEEFKKLNELKLQEKVEKEKAKAEADAADPEKKNDVAS